MESSESKEDLLPQDPWAVSTGGNDLALKGTGHDSVVVTPQEDAFSVGDPIILGEETVSVNHEELTSSNAIGNATAEALYLEHSFVQDCQKEVSRTVDSNNCNSILVLGRDIAEGDEIQEFFSQKEDSINLPQQLDKTSELGFRRKIPKRLTNTKFVLKFIGFLSFFELMRASWVLFF